MFAFDEVFAIAQKLAASFSTLRNQWFPIPQLFGKMAVDFLLTIRCSTGDSTNLNAPHQQPLYQQQPPSGLQTNEP